MIPGLKFLSDLLRLRRDWPPFAVTGLPAESTARKSKRVDNPLPSSTLVLAEPSSFLCTHVSQMRMACVPVVEASELIDAVVLTFDPTLWNKSERIRIVLWVVVLW